MKKTFRLLRWAAFALLSISATVLFAQTHPGASWAGDALYVVDGDSIRVRPINGGKPVSIRLQGIDAPELCQSYGKSSREFLSQRVRGQRIRVAGKARDSYGRLVAQVFLEGEDIGEWMVVQGYAWSYRYHGDGGPYARQQRQAEQSHRGLFSQSHIKPQYPGEFRSQNGVCPHAQPKKRSVLAH